MFYQTNILNTQEENRIKYYLVVSQHTLIGAAVSSVRNVNAIR
jgi:hypothetical protein